MCPVYKGYSKLRTHTAPRVVLCCQDWPYDRTLRRCVSLVPSNPCRDTRPGMRLVSPRLDRNEKQFRGELAFKAHRWLCQLTLGSRVMKKKESLD